MATKTYKVKDDCKGPNCQSPVYYYEARLVLDNSLGEQNARSETVKKRILACSCTGEDCDQKHVRTYEFPNHFEEIPRP